jgi:hypothetical protein
MSATTDLAILILPIPLVWSLHMPFQKKIRIEALLGAGGIATEPVSSNLFLSFNLIILRMKKGDMQDCTCYVLSPSSSMSDQHNTHRPIALQRSSTIPSISALNLLSREREKTDEADTIMEEEEEEELGPEKPWTEASSIERIKTLEGEVERSWSMKIGIIVVLERVWTAEEEGEERVSTGGGGLIHGVFICEVGMRRTKKLKEESLM